MCVCVCVCVRVCVCVCVLILAPPRLILASAQTAELDAVRKTMAAQQKACQDRLAAADAKLEAAKRANHGLEVCVCVCVFVCVCAWRVRLANRC